MLWRRITLGLAAALIVGVGLLSGNGEAQAAPLAAPHVINKQILSETSIDGPGITRNDIGHEGDRAMVLAWTGTDPGHRLNLLTTDNGTTWKNKRTLSETSFVRPAVERMTYMDDGTVILAWTGTDPNHTLNVLWNAYNNSSSPMKKVTFWGDRSFTAPAMVMWGNDLLVAWAGTDAKHSLNIMALSLETLKVVSIKRYLPFSSIARPSLLVDRSGNVMLAWTNPAGQLAFATSSPSLNFGAAKVSANTSFAGPDVLYAYSIYIQDTATPRFWWAWTGKDAHRSIHVAFSNTAAWPPASNSATLGDWALGGPVLAWRGATNRVVLAWTGTDPLHRLNVAEVSLT